MKGAFNGAEKFFKKPLVDVARTLEYSEENICILSGDEMKLKECFPDTLRNLISCGHNKDRRTYLKYGQDLVASWLVEDYFKMILNKDGLVVKLNGADKNRKLLSTVNVSSSSDFEAIFDGKTQKLELMNDYGGFWKWSHTLHLRDFKYLKMKSEKSLLLAVSLATEEFTIFNFKKDINFKYLRSHRFYGGKPAYELAIREDMLKKATQENIVDALKRELIE